jgi:hypothetical protein
MYSNGCIYPTTFHILMYTIYYIVSISEGLKSPLPLWSCDITMPNCSQEAIVSRIIRRLRHVEDSDSPSLSNTGRCQYLGGWLH